MTGKLTVEATIHIKSALDSLNEPLIHSFEMKRRAWGDEDKTARVKEESPLGCSGFWTAFSLLATLNVSQVKWIMGKHPHIQRRETVAQLPFSFVTAWITKTKRFFSKQRQVWRADAAVGCLPTNPCCAKEMKTEPEEWWRVNSADELLW